MRTETKYISELGRICDTKEAAIEDDMRLPGIIHTYELDLARMREPGAVFANKPVTEELKEEWKRAIAGYKRKWANAQNSW